MPSTCYTAAAPTTSPCYVWWPRRKALQRWRKQRRGRGCSLRPSTMVSTMSPTSCPVSATPAIASSGRAKLPGPGSDREFVAQCGGVVAGSGQILGDRAPDFDVELDLRFGTRRPHHDPGPHIVAASGEDQRIRAIHRALREICCGRGEFTEPRRRRRAQSAHQFSRLVSVAHRARYGRADMDPEAAGEVVERVEHRPL